MSSFIFQATAGGGLDPELEHDLSSWPQVDQIVEWKAQRYRSKMKPGDLAFFWQAGASEVRGIHGWGHVDSPPADEGKGYRVKVRFECRLVPHLSAAKLEKVRELRTRDIFTVRVGSNFLLESEEVKKIVEQIPIEQRPSLEGG